ncbi:MAG TPA: PSD1 and planctomycete cytochrome C domain-containing protein [Planctomycetaceae bacterium]|nr:PSD1 and planctomycete cytochrome C domain-containing protein [Planctomycetaceae bacterium]
MSIRLLAVVVLVKGVIALATTARADDKIDFPHDIRPILSENCFQCHGPDDAQRKADLRLDTREGAFSELNGTRPIVSGKPGESEVYLRITSNDPAVAMPPAKSGKKLTAKQIDLIKTWIEQGARWNTHWAFEAPRRPAVPTVQNGGWVRNPIDAFIMARLVREGLAPAAEAGRIALLRRLSLDLIGLPPTIAETDAFLRDQNQDAYENAVDRLLASPHYGERWGRIWLDAARYADSDGYEKDKPRYVWSYRDWVINAFNQNLPYDRFIIEQIAGDLIAGAGPQQLMATGFLRNSMINEEGGVDPEQFRMEAMFDRMDAIGKGILGLTIQCAQCHSHKFDPLTHEEYYGLFAFLNNSHESSVAAYTAGEQMVRADILRQIDQIESELKQKAPDWPERLAQWEASVAGNQPEWAVIQAAEDDLSGGQKMYRMKDGSYLCQGYAPTKHDVVLNLTTSVQNITAFRLEQLNDPNLPLGGPGRSIKGTAALTEFKVRAKPLGKADQLEAIKFVKATADVNPPEKPLDTIFDDKTGKSRITGPVEFAIDGKEETAWTIDNGPGRRNKPCKAVFVPEKPIAFPEGAELEIHLVQNHGGWNSDDNQNYNLGRFRLSVTSAADPVADPLPADVRGALGVAREQRTPAQSAALFSYFRSTVVEWQEANAAIDEIWKRHPEGSSQLVMNERAEPRATRVLERGDFLKPASPVVPGVPAFLHPLPAGAPANRLSFAQWLADRNSPTTARSFVNRVWQSYFGTGLVSTSEDLGSQSEMPSHPELLDWLAVEFMEPTFPSPGSGGNEAWDIKRLHRLIVTSATYRQSSKITPELYARDPFNRLLARGPRHRVDAETIRDVALAASGLLNDAIGGPSVFPTAPDFLFLPPASYGPKTWKADTGAGRFRRALYTFRYRSVPYPALQAFDAPNGDFSCVRRTRSNTPLQALTSLNEPIFLECARGLALRTLSEGGGSDRERLTFAFRRCVARPPTDHEATALLGLLGRQLQRFGDGKHNPWDLAAADPEHPPALPAGTSPAQLAAWTAVSRVLLNLDETITKE